MSTSTLTALTNGTYDVNIYGANAYTGVAVGGRTSYAFLVTKNGVAVGDCMDKNGSPNDGQNIGSIVVNNGTGAGTFAVPMSDLTADGAGRFANVCTSDPGGGTGGPQTPILII
jgi:hypothetical protein